MLLLQEWHFIYHYRFILIHKMFFFFFFEGEFIFKTEYSFLLFKFLVESNLIIGQVTTWLPSNCLLNFLHLACTCHLTLNENCNLMKNQLNSIFAVPPLNTRERKIWMQLYSRQITKRQSARWLVRIKYSFN